MQPIFLSSENNLSGFGGTAMTFSYKGIKNVIKSVPKNETLVTGDTAVTTLPVML